MPLSYGEKAHLSAGIGSCLPHVNRVVPRDAIQHGKSGHRVETIHLHLSTDTNRFMLGECHLGFVVDFNCLTIVAETPKAVGAEDTCLAHNFVCPSSIVS